MRDKTRITKTMKINDINICFGKQKTLHMEIYAESYLTAEIAETYRFVKKIWK